MGQPYYNQQSFRWRDDDGSESGATWLATANNPLPTVALDTTYRLRTLVQNTGDKVGSITGTLYFRVNSGAWTAATTTSSYVRLVTSGYVSDDATTSQQLGSGSWVAGRFDSNGTVTSVTITNGYETEYEYCFQFRSADLSGGDVVELRTQNATVALNNYTNTASATMPSGEITQANFRVRTTGYGLNVDNGWLGALNANVEVDSDDRFYIRFELEESTGASKAISGLKLQYNRSGAGWTDITYQTWLLELANPTCYSTDSDDWNDGDATTNLLSGSSETFAAGTAEENCTAIAGVNLGSEHTEIEVCLIIRKFYDGPSHNADGTTYQFRLVESDGTALDGYTNTPTITLNHAVGHVGGTSVESPQKVGPFCDDNGNLYLIIEPCESDPEFMMLKSTDGGDSWLEVDGAGRPTTTDLESVDGQIVGDTIWIIQQGYSTDYVHLHSFNMSSHGTNPDEWVITNELVTSASNCLDQSACIAVLSDGRIRAWWMQTGGTYEEVWWNTRSSGGSWGTAAAFATGANHFGVRCVVGASDKVHVFYYDQDGDDVYHVSVASDNTVSSAELVTATAATSIYTWATIGVPVYWDDDGDEKIMVAYLNSSNYAYSCVITNDGSPETPKQITTVAIDESGSDSRVPVAYLSLIPGTKRVQFIYSRYSNQTLYMDYSENDGGWQTTDETLDAYPVVDWLYGNIFTHSAGNGGETVFGYFVDDGSDGYSGFTDYHEYVLDVVSYVNFVVSGDAVSSIADLDVDVTRAVTISGAAASSTADVDLNVTRLFTIGGDAVSSIANIDLAIIKLFTILANAVSSTADIDLNVTRQVTIAGDAVSSIADIDLNVTRLFTILANAVSTITDVDLSIIKLFTILANAVSAIADIDLGVTREITIEGSAASSIADADLNVTRSVNISGDAVSTITDIDLNVVKLFTILAAAVSAITDVDLDVTREFTVQGNAVSNISNIDLLISGIIEFIISGNATSAVTDVDLNVLRSVIIEGNAVSNITDIDLLISGIIEFIISGNASSAITDINLAVTRQFTVEGNAVSGITNVDLAIQRLFTVLGNAVSTISDIDLGLILEFIINGGATSAINDIDLNVTRAMAILGNAVSQVSDIDLPIQRQFSVQGDAVSNISNVDLNDAAIALLGLLVMILSGKVPRTGMSGSTPGATMNGSAPDITLTGRA